MKQLSAISDTKVLIDTNILIAYAEDGFVERSGNPLKILRESNNILLLSKISEFELLRNQKKLDIIEKYQKFVSLLNTVDVENRYLTNAALLSSEYERLNCNARKDVGDLLIAGTVLTNELNGEEILLFTENRKHFPEPLWQAEACYLVQESDGDFVQKKFFILKLDISFLVLD